MADSWTPSRDMDDLPTRFALATNLMHSGDGARAASAFRDIVRDFPACHEAHYMLGRIALSQGDASHASIHFTEAERLDAGNPEYAMRLAQAALVRNDSDDAVRWAEIARAESEVESPELLTTLARALTLARRFDDAASLYADACDASPHDPALWLARSAVQRQLMDIDSAEASLRRAVALAPHDPAPLAELALMLERANRLEPARTAAEEALKIAPAHPTGLLVRARLVRRQGDLSGARRDLEQAVANAPTPDARRNACITLAQVLDELGEYDLAFSRMQESKKPIAEVPTSLRDQGEHFLAYIAAMRSQIIESRVQQWNAPPPDGRQAPVFFVGFPRSGTTLLEQMLASHPRFVTTDEHASLPVVRERLRRAIGSESRFPEALDYLTESQIVELRELYWAETTALFGTLRPGIRVVDKHPLNTANLAIVRRIFPDALVLMSLRDPRDIVVSCMMNLTRTPMAATLFHSFDTTARFYAAMMDLWLHFRDELGLRWLETRYEDVIADAEREVRRVLLFLGEPWNDEVMRFREHAQKRAIRSPSYEQVTRALHRGAIGRWRRYEKHMGASLPLLQPFVTALGYDACGG